MLSSEIVIELINAIEFRQITTKNTCCSAEPNALLSLLEVKDLSLKDNRIVSITFDYSNLVNLTHHTFSNPTPAGPVVKNRFMFGI